MQKPICVCAPVRWPCAASPIISRFPYNAQPAPDQPISLSRIEFDEACAELQRNGVPLMADRDQAWRDFSGWRVNYDTVLLALAAITIGPLRAVVVRSILITRRAAKKQSGFLWCVCSP